MLNNIITYTACPICNNTNFKQHLVVKDHTVSHENFDVAICNNCTAAFTQHVPVQNEIGKYYQSENYISHSDTKDGLISKVYHSVRNITLKSKKNIIEKYTATQAGKLLDIGAGTGAFAHIMQKNNWQVVGLEPDETARNNAKNKYNIDLQNPQNLFEQPAETYNAITLWHVLEHIHTLHEYFATFNKILQPNGKLFIAVPNYTSYDAEHYKQFWAGYDVPRHLYHFSPQSMQHLAAQYGFTIQKHLPMWFDSTYVAMLSEQYKTGKNNFIKAFLIGMLSNVKTMFSAKKCSSVIYILSKT